MGSLTSINGRVHIPQSLEESTPTIMNTSSVPTSASSSEPSSSSSSLPSSTPSSAPTSAPLSPPASPESNQQQDLNINTAMTTTTTDTNTTSGTKRKISSASTSSTDAVNVPLSPSLSPSNTTTNANNNISLSADEHFKLFNSSFDMNSLNDVIEKASLYFRKVLSIPYHTPTMIPSCMTSLPSGDETGTFLSVDLGGSTFRVAFVTLNGRNKQTDILYKSVLPVPDSIKRGSGKVFFLWMAKEIKRGIEALEMRKNTNNDGIPIKMGVSWSFPFIQKTMESAIIEKMGKGYTVADEITGWNLRDAFEEAFNQLNINVRVAAIVNDGAACMISRAYSDPTTKISLILGTGINAGIMLPANVIADEKFTSVLGYSNSNVNFSLVNTEISMLGDSIIPETIWDNELDSLMEHPGFQPLETKVSGRYLGEISRLIIRDMILNNGLCDGVFPKGLDIPYGLESAVMSDIEKHYRNNRMDLVQQVLTNSHPHPAKKVFNDSDLHQICSVFVAVSTRSAALTAAVLVSLADILNTGTSTDILNCTIAFTGTVIERFPNFRERCQQYLDVLSESRGMKLRLGSSEDGSLLGPVIAAAMGSIITAI